MARLPETVEGLRTVANHETRVQRVYERVYKLKSEMGIPYNKMAEQAGLSRGKMEKLTGKSRRMTEENLDKLVTYLDSMGF
jgi:DNA-binding Xre family transcriptional regulator